jgi:hypothetical protein
MFQVSPLLVYIPPLPTLLSVLMTAANFVPSADEEIAHQFLTGVLFEVQVDPESVEV